MYFIFVWIFKVYFIVVDASDFQMVIILKLEVILFCRLRLFLLKSD